MSKLIMRIPLAMGIAVLFTFAIAISIAFGGTVYTDPLAFDAATQNLEDPTIIDFEDIDASPINDTFLGRPTFDGAFYADQGVVFSNPDGYDFYITPGGLFWNESNSLSPFRFPFDPTFPPGYEVYEEDDLLVTLNPPCAAFSLTLVDNGSASDDEYFQFIDTQGEVVAQVGLPPGSAPYRAFIGILSTDRPIAEVYFEEAPNDGDDVNFDDITCFPAFMPISIDIKPGSDPNSINLNSKGVVPVAILTTEVFDATTVDPVTALFAGASPLRWTIEDVDLDGDIDLLFHFRTQELNLDENSTEAILKGETFDGMPIVGSDLIRIRPPK